ncbi:SRPBCC domain-containing protein [Mucilaginibacter sp. SMC90]|uniref:SRPBCC family protein n=1 Tax=Mucilaginibacter sp. SMC90 TaxID=2929803 RepID=UPI001FB47EAF|nr:SRPBCC domain-containing protein [Mucilaginibacter sp. SMC90]UOE51639.1 SRPBCC domain-containing protein [Mucilaginibacter sp. SMC90]
MSTQPFVIERVYAAPIQKVWEAITVKEKMKAWYFDLAEFKPEVGFEFEFTGGDENKQYLHLCRVTKVVEGKTIAYTWRYDGYEGESEVTWELFPEGEGTKLILTHSGLETFPPLDAFKKENFAAGWTHITGISLKEYLEK